MDSTEGGRPKVWYGVIFLLLLVGVVFIVQSTKDDHVETIPEVLELSPQAKKLVLLEFGNRMSFFYLSPTQESFDRIQDDAVRYLGALQSKGSNADNLASVFIAKCSGKYGWPVKKGPYFHPVTDILNPESKFAEYMADNSIMNADKLDILWTSFFASGNEEYVTQILDFALLDTPEDDVKKTVSILAVRWSFKNNCLQHEKLLA